MKQFGNDELAKRVDEVLYYVWDPIGVCDAPEARGEYTSYIPKVLAMVQQNNEIEPISLYLANIVSEQMGLRPDKKNCDYVAELLLGHREAIKNGLY